MLIRVGYALVVFLLELVLFRVRIRIAPAPKLFNEFFPLVVRLEPFEGFPFFVRNYIRDVLFQPGIPDAKFSFAYAMRS